MQNRFVTWLIILLVLLVPVGWVAWPTNTSLNIPLGDNSIQRDISIRQGLDLQGGLQVLLEADLPADQPLEQSAMETAKDIIANRVNGLGVSEPVVQLAGDRRIVVELPGLGNVDQALSLIKQTGLLEFVDTGSTPIPEGTVIQTDYVSGATSTNSLTATTGAATTAATDTAAATPSAAPTGPVYHTLMTGTALVSANPGRQEITNEIVIQFELTPEGATTFAQHTAANRGKFLTIVLDKTVISSPQIEDTIPDGKGIIRGNFTAESANTLALQLRYGSLPIPLKVAESRIIGPTLGQDSLNKSLVAGLIGLGAVMIFMALYYRLPGLVANISILGYAAIALAIFKLIPVTLTLAGVAGFMLSTGSALDANILIFERLKEELRSGRNLGQALELAWRRAWSSIRDSNIATLIICAILLWFASTFGATIVRGFAVTLMIGIGISLFTALVITRLLLNVVLHFFKPADPGKWFGV